MNIGDIFRGVACYADELFVESTGRPLTHYSVIITPANKEAAYHEDACKVSHDCANPTSLRGFYELPCETACGTFGIDAPDETDFELGFHTAVKKLGKIPSIGDMLVDCVNGKWVVINRHRKDDMVRGQNRLILTARRYQESVTTGGEDGEHHQGTVRQEAGVV